VKRDRYAAVERRFAFAATTSVQAGVSHGMRPTGFAQSGVFAMMLSSRPGPWWVRHDAQFERYSV
jgi:hypothetical protein